MFFSSLPGSPGPSIPLKFERATQGAPCSNTKALGQSRLGCQARVAPPPPGETCMAATGTGGQSRKESPAATAAWGLRVLEYPPARIFQRNE